MIQSPIKIETNVMKITQASTTWLTFSYDTT